MSSKLFFILFERVFPIPIFLISFADRIYLDREEKGERERTAVDDVLEEGKLSTRVTAINKT